MSRADCDVHCPAGLEMSADSQCVPCPVGSFKTTSMLVCRRCDLGFSTALSGCSKPEQCDVVHCPRGHYTNPTLSGKENQRTHSSADVCPACPLGFYQDLSGQRDCKRCPEGRQTRRPASTRADDCELDLSVMCVPSEPQPCPAGQECVYLNNGRYECRVLQRRESHPAAQDLPDWVWMSFGGLLFVVAGSVLLAALIYRKKL